MRPHEGVAVSKIIVSHIEAKVGVGNCGVRHVKRIDNLLKEMRGEVFIAMDVVNGEKWNGGRKAKHTAYLTKEINKSHDKQSSHMLINKQLETDQRTIIEQTIGNQSKNNHRKNDWKLIETEPQSHYVYKGKG